MMITKFVVLILILWACIVQSVHSTKPGGWGNVPFPNLNDGVVGSALFAAHEIFSDLVIATNVVSAFQQVVAGINYRMYVEVARICKPCEYYQFTVWDRFGNLTLMYARNLQIPCTLHIMHSDTESSCTET